MLFNTSDSIQHNLFMCTQLNDFKCSKWLNSSIWPLDGTLTGTTTLDQNGPGINGNKDGLHIPQNSSAGVSPSKGLVSYPGYLLGRGLLSAEMQFSKPHPTGLK